MPKKILKLDFDGVLHSYTSGWQGAHIASDPPVEGAIAFLREAVKHFRVCIFSSRSNQPGGILAMARWVTKWGALHRLSDDEDLSWMDAIEFPTEKPPAFVGLDDRVLCFNGRFPLMETLLNFQPWNKR